MFTVFPSNLAQAFMGRCVLGMELIRSQPINNLWTINVSVSFHSSCKWQSGPLSNLVGV